MRRLGTTAIVEFPPAGALTGIAKRELRGVATHAVKTPADLDGLTDL
jgi:[acyl-carrier-protein] S-malonyltransferase